MITKHYGVAPDLDALSFLPPPLSREFDKNFCTAYSISTSVISANLTRTTPIVHKSIDEVMTEKIQSNFFTNEKKMFGILEYTSDSRKFKTQILSEKDRFSVDYRNLINKNK